MSEGVQTAALSLWYGSFQALRGVDLRLHAGGVHSLIGPSGCGKSTLLRCLNRINERIPGVRTSGSVHIHGHDIYADDVDPIELRKRVGMVFQRPNPLPLTVRQNLQFQGRLFGEIPSLETIESVLQEVGSWDALKDQLDRPALSLPLEQQQRLCIARLLPMRPDVLLLDEPCSALDPFATERVEELILGMRGRYTIVIVTHNMAQARRASDTCAFMLMGELVEHGRTADLFLAPKDTRTADYVEGRYG